MFTISKAISQTSSKLYTSGIKPASGSRCRRGRREGDTSTKNESTHLHPGLSDSSAEISNVVFLYKESILGGKIDISFS